jgi:CDP-diacylglycerol--glycerol-3-phosphate 3-phosphatidyltransferase
MKLVPNALSLARIFLTPFFVIFFFEGTYKSFVYAFFVFTIAALTDMYDGYIARKYNVSSSLGMFLDPLADKVLITVAFSCFIFYGFVSWWMVGIILGRDVLVTFMRLWLIKNNMTLQTSFLAKYKTASQFVALYIMFLVVLYAKKHSIPVNDCAISVLNVMMYGVVILTTYSAIKYSVNFWRFLQKK